MSAVSPFPWHALAHVGRAEARALTEARRWTRAHIDMACLPGVFAELLDAEVDVRVRAAAALQTARGLEGGAGVLLARADRPVAGEAVLVEGEPALVATCLRLAARKPTAFSFNPAAPLTPAALGGFAALLAAAVRRAHAGTALRVLAVGPAETLEADLLSAGPELTAVTLTTLVAHDAFEARVVLPRAAALGAPTPTWSAEALAALGPTPLELPIVASAERFTAAELASLEVGDVLLPRAWAVARSGGGFTGKVFLAAPDAEAGLCAELGADGRLVLVGGLVPLSGAEANMDEGQERSELIDAVGDVPVLVRVEIGEARMAARDWAAVGRGDVLALGRRVGEPVVLRVGGVPVARGDLVELDGEVGVRIVERLAADREKR